MKIAIDLDDTLVDLNQQIILFHNERYGTSYCREDFTDYSYWKIWGGSREEAIRKTYEFLSSEYYCDIPPIPGAQDAVAALKAQGYELAIVTGREACFDGITSSLADRHFPGAFAGIFYGSAYAINAVKIKKSTLCRQWGAAVLVDDDLTHIIDCVENGMPVLAFDTPWNQGRLPEGVAGFSSWEKIYQHLVRE